MLVNVIRAGTESDANFGKKYFFGKSSGVTSKITFSLHKKIIRGKGTKVKKRRKKCS